MRILNINSKTNYNIAPQFKGLRAKPKTLSDIFTQQPNKFRCEANAISEITNVRPFEFCGTQCKNSIPLKNFWDFFSISLCIILVNGSQPIPERNLSSRTSAICHVMPFDYAADHGGDCAFGVWVRPCDCKQCL